MKYAFAALLIMAPGSAAAEITAADMQRQQMLATEAAIRAGATRPRPVIVRPATPAAAAPQGVGRSADGFFPLKRETAAREFALPPRAGEAAPSSASLQALMATSNNAKPAAPADPQPDAAAANTSDALNAFDDFRRSHGVNR